MAQPTVNPALYGALKYRCIGPHRGGRVVAVAGDPVDRQTVYCEMARERECRRAVTLVPTTS
jgi:hypothetical protein